jgi:hypothetical protein
MNHHRSPRLVALAVVVAIPLLGLSGIASAKTHHHHGAGGAGGAASNITIQIDPNILPETGPSEIHAVVQVEANPNFAGDLVTVSSSQLNASCKSASYEAVSTPPSTTDISVPLDNNGNAAVLVVGIDCAPGNDVFEADLSVAPFLTTLAILRVYPPFVLVPGVYPNPSTSGSVKTGQVETGDNPPNESSIINVFYVATDPVYAEQPVEIDSSQLDARCTTGWLWSPGNQSAPGSNPASGVGPNPGPEATAILDDDGNAVFVFAGTSCAAGSSLVVADVEAGTHPTYTNTFTILPPQPTI